MEKNTIKEMIARNIIVDIKAKRTDIDIACENEIIRLMLDTHILEMIVNVPIIINNTIRYIESIRVDTKKESIFHELQFKLDNDDEYIYCDDIAETTNNFGIPYMNILLVISNSLFPNILD